MQLDPEQAQVAAWRPGDGSLRVVAPAGSGKTSSVVALAANLLNQRHLAPHHLVLTTFGNDAAREIKDRLKRQAPQHAPRIGSFHALAYRHLSDREPRRWDMRLCLDAGGGQRATVDTLNGYTLWRTVTEYGRIPGVNKPSLRCAESFDAVKAYSAFADLMRAKGINRPEDIPTGDLRKAPREFDEAWNLFREAKAALRWWDWADALDAYLVRLKERGDSAHAVFVDEAQDNNAVQLEIAKQLAANGGGPVVLVGQLAQCIHRWRGATPDLFRNADKELGAKTIALLRNYRSVGPIVALANRICANQPWKLEPDSIANRTDMPDKAPVRTLTSCDEEVSVFQAVAEEVEVAIADIPGRPARKPGYFAVLTRTNAQLIEFQAALAEKNIPCAVYGGSSALDTREFESAIAYAVLAQHDAMGALQRAAHLPKRFLPNDFAQKAFPGGLPKRSDGRPRPASVAFTEAIKATPGLTAGSARGAWSLAADLERLRSVPWDKVPEVIEEILLPPKEAIRKLRPGADPNEDKPALIKAATRFLRRFPNAWDACLRFYRIKEVSELADGAPPEDRVVLTTAHRFKGREAGRVYLYVESGTFPHRKTEAKEMEDEHRLFYVACTRARDSLVAVYREEPSEFAIRFMEKELRAGGWSG